MSRLVVRANLICLGIKQHGGTDLVGASTGTKSRPLGGFSARAIAPLLASRGREREARHDSNEQRNSDEHAGEQREDGR